MSKPWTKVKQSGILWVMAGRFHTSRDVSHKHERFKKGGDGLLVLDGRASLSVLCTVLCSGSAAEGAQETQSLHRVPNSLLHYEAPELLRQTTLFRSEVGKT